VWGGQNLYGRYWLILKKKKNTAVPKNFYTAGHWQGMETGQEEVIYSLILYYSG